MKKKISIALAVVSVSGIANAQTNGSSSNGKPSAYGTAAPNGTQPDINQWPVQSPVRTTPHAVQSPAANAYRGVSQPPTDPILSNETPDVMPQATTVTPPVQAVPIQAAASSAPVMPSAVQNPDAGIVEVPVPDDATAASAPRLLQHDANPDAGIVTEVEGSPNVLMQGTPLHAKMLDDISADLVTPGTPFTAQLTQDVTHMGVVIFPAGSYIHGRVAYANVGRRITGQSSMKLRPEEVVLPDGTHYFFRGIVTETAGSETRANAEGEIVAKGHPIRTASEYGMTAGSGAILGGVVAGPVGAVAGAGIGAGLMTVHVLREHNAPVLNAGSMITFALSAPLSLNVAPSGGTALRAPSQAGPAAAYAPATPAYVEPKIQN